MWLLWLLPQQVRWRLPRNSCFFLFVRENWIWHFMQIISIGDCCCLSAEILPSMLSIYKYLITLWIYIKTKIIFIQSYCVKIYNNNYYIHNNPKYWDRQVWASCADLDQKLKNVASGDQGLNCLLFIQQFLGILAHYENTPIQIDRKFHLQKLKIFR